MPILVVNQICSCSVNLRVYLFLSLAAKILAREIIIFPTLSVLTYYDHYASIKPSKFSCKHFEKDIQNFIKGSQLPTFKCENQLKKVPPWIMDLGWNFSTAILNSKRIGADKSSCSFYSIFFESINKNGGFKIFTKLWISPAHAVATLRWHEWHFPNFMNWWNVY